MDAVHGLYYLLLHLEFAVTGPGVLALRLPRCSPGQPPPPCSPPSRRASATGARPCSQACTGRFCRR
ncbi:hypothetical protein ACFQZC_24640 [Streptacidiphilus monticola]